MQVQFGLGVLAEETARQSVKAGGHYLLIVDSCGKICEEGLAHHGETESRKKPGSSSRSRDTREKLSPVVQSSIGMLRLRIQVFCRSPVCSAQVDNVFLPSGLIL